MPTKLLFALYGAHSLSLNTTFMVAILAKHFWHRFYVRIKTCLEGGINFIWIYRFQNSNLTNWWDGQGELNFIFLKGDKNNARAVHWDKINAVHNVFDLIYDIFPVAVLNWPEGSGVLRPMVPAFSPQRWCWFLTMSVFLRCEYKRYSAYCEALPRFFLKEGLAGSDSKERLLLWASSSLFQLQCVTSP